MGEGRLTTELGVTANFANTILIMTSNVGAELFDEVRPNLSGEPRAVSEADLSRAVHQRFRPEFLNRITNVLHFRELGPGDVRQIAKFEVKKALQRPGLLSREISVAVDESVLDLLMRRGYSRRYGARPMQRAVDDLVAAPLAAAIAAGKLGMGTRTTIIAEDHAVIIRVQGSGLAVGRGIC